MSKEPQSLPAREQPIGLALSNTLSHWREGQKKVTYNPRDVPRDPVEAIEFVESVVKNAGFDYDAEPESPEFLLFADVLHRLNRDKLMRTPAELGAETRRRSSFFRIYIPKDAAWELEPELIHTSEGTGQRPYGVVTLAVFEAFYDSYKSATFPPDRLDARNALVDYGAVILPDSHSRWASPPAKDE